MVSQFFQTVDGGVLWNPSNSVAVVFAAMAQTLSEITRTPSGIGPVSQDEYVVDLDEFGAFVAAVTRWYDASHHDCIPALAAGWLSVARAKILGEPPLARHGIRVIARDVPSHEIDRSARLPDRAQRLLRWEPKQLPTDPFTAEMLRDFVDSNRTQLREGTRAWTHPLTGGGNVLDLRGAALDGIPLDDAVLCDASLQLVSLRGAHLHKANLSHAKLDGADLTDAVLRKAELYEASARTTVFHAADLCDVLAVGADLRDADLGNARLDLASFSRADLRGANLRGARFDDPWMDLAGAKLAGARFDAAVGCVWGPVDISDTGQPQVIDGPELAQWFEATHPGAVITVRQATHFTLAAARPPAPTSQNPSTGKETTDA
ncbi:DUF6086 family protein [Polymorphospora sp. NPDC050346]|uniref:DUF6086 family protein n=1 Tax=Polymorphospora sp. NPDC050346 TaxID=3155780 RepID=UPI0033E0811E